MIIQYDICKKLIEIRSESLINIPEELLCDELYKIAFKYNAKLIGHPKLILREDYSNLCEIAIEYNQMHFEKYINSNRFPGDCGYKLYKYDCYPIMYIPTNTIGYGKICKIMINRYPTFISYIEPQFMNEKLCKLAISKGCPLKLIPEKFKYLFGFVKSNKSTNNHCLIKLDNLEKGEEYYQCPNKSDHIISVKYFDIWLNTSGDKQNNCIICQIPINILKIYINQ